MARERFFRPSTYRNYPEVGYLALHADEATLPRHSQRRLRPNTPYIDHTVYLGTTNHEDNGQTFRNFYERKAGLRRLHGRQILSSGEYKRVLAEEGVPQAPAENSWRLAAVLYVPAIRALAMVELPEDGTKQSRVTTIGQRRIPRRETQVALPTREASEFRRVSLNNYVKELEALGFPEGAFDHVKRDWTSKSKDHTTLTSEGLDATFPLSWFVDQVIIRPIRAISERAHRHGRLLETIRTENSRPDLRSTV